jgi:hypothetical protein
LQSSPQQQQVQQRAAVAAAAGQPTAVCKQLSPLQRVLAGYQTPWPLVPGSERVLGVLETNGLAGLKVYLDYSSFYRPYSQFDKVGTRDSSGDGNRGAHCMGRGDCSGLLEKWFGYDCEQKASSVASAQLL